MGKTVVLLFIVLITVVGTILFIGRSTLKPIENQQGIQSSKDKTNEKSLEVLAENLEVPWDIAFLADDKIILTERAGRVRLIDKGKLKSDPVFVFSDVKASGEGGLLGVTADPDFPDLIYFYYTYSQSGNNTLNRVVRFKFEDDKLTEQKILIDKIPGALFHNGGRIRFGPDKYLYITTGDAQNPSLSQNTSSLAGKILRVTRDGDIPVDNPFKNPVYSYGHRNPQGLAWDGEGKLWATEHGSSANDELNSVEKGKNYGWPDITGNQKKEGVISPILQSGQDTWAPAGMIYHKERLFFVGLRGQALFEVSNLKNPAFKKHFQGEFGRIRSINLGPDNYFYLLTSNRDGRGIPKTGDDKILKIPDSL